MRQLPPVPDLRMVFGSLLGQTTLRTQTTTNLQSPAGYTFLRFRQEHNLLKSWYATVVNRIGSKLKTMKNRSQGAHGSVIRNARRRDAATTMKTLKRHAMVTLLFSERKIAPNILKSRQPGTSKTDGWNSILSPKAANKLM